MILGRNSAVTENTFFESTERPSMRLRLPQTVTGDFEMEGFATMQLKTEGGLPSQAAGFPCEVAAQSHGLLCPPDVQHKEWTGRHSWGSAAGCRSS